MKNKKIENSLFKTSNSKITDKIGFLRTNKEFQKDVRVLRKKWVLLIKEYNYYLERINNMSVIEKLIKSIGEEVEMPLSSQKEKNIAEFFGKKIEKIISNSDFEKDIINLTKKNKLYPIEHWGSAVKIYVLTNYFSPPSYSFKIGLVKNFPKKEIFDIPKNLNFSIKMEKNKKTKELELFVQIFENTILRDLKNNWRLIMKCQEKLIKKKEIKKRYHSHKNLKIEKKLLKLDSKKMSDSEKQEKIWGEVGSLNFGEIEKKRKNRLKKIRQRYKEKIKP